MSFLSQGRHRRVIWGCLAVHLLLGCGTVLPRTEPMPVAEEESTGTISMPVGLDLIQDAREAVAESSLRAGTNSRILFVPPSEECFVTGGERNMALLTLAMQGFGFETHSLINDGECSKMLRDAGTLAHTGETNLPQCFPPEHFDRFQKALDAWMRDAQNSKLLARVQGARGSLQRELALAKQSACVSRSLDERAVQVIRSFIRLEPELLKTKVDTIVTDLPWDALAAILLTRGTSTQVVSYIQSADADPSDAVVGRFTSVVACSHPSAARFAGMPQVTLVKNGVNPQRFFPDRASTISLRALLDVDNDAFVIGQTGYIDGNKNQLAVVRAAVLAAQKVPDLHVAFFGVTPQPHYLQSLKDEISDHGLSERIHFIGHRHDLASLLGQLDVFAFPSRQESFGLSLAEAMSTGLPVIANRLPAYDDFMCEGVHLLDVEDSDAFAKAIVSVNEEGPGRRARGMRGREQIIAKGLTTNRMLEEFAVALGAAPPADLGL